MKTIETKLNVSLLTYTPDPEKIISASAKLCYSSSGIDNLLNNLTRDNINKFLNKLIDMGHESPIEHVSFTFGIEGVSRSLTHQLVRHRLASYSQKSQRYVREGQFSYIMPPEIEKSEKAKALYTEAMENDQAIYNKLVRILIKDNIDKYFSENNIEWASEDKASMNDFFKINLKSKYNEFEKQAIEDARYVLPNACETKIICTMNARQLMHFFEKRCCNRAQWEIREMATQMLILSKQVAPILFKNAGPGCIDGHCPEENMTCGEFIKTREKFHDLMR